MSKEIRVSVDQFTVTFACQFDNPELDAENLIDQLRLTDYLGNPEEVNAVNRYDHALGWLNPNLKIMWKADDPKQRVAFLMTATGKRNLEYSWRGDRTWLEEFRKYRELDGRFSRVDVAIDLIDYNIDLEKLLNRIKRGKVKVLDSLGRTVRGLENIKYYGEGNKVTGFYIGSPTSDALLRFYDKKIEQNSISKPFYLIAKEVEDWTRIEAEFTGKYANAILEDIVDSVNNEQELQHKLIGYIVNHWHLAAYHKLLFWSDLEILAEGQGDVPRAFTSNENKLIRMIQYFLTGGPAGILFKIQELFQDDGLDEFFSLVKEYLSMPNEYGYYYPPKSIARDINLIRKQNPELDSIDEYFEQAFYQIKAEKKPNRARQDND